MLYKILLVEDNNDSCAFLSQLLKLKGYEVHTAADGLEALSKVETCHPDLIISDLMMPNLDGMGLMKALRQTPDYQTPILMLSAHGSGNLRNAIKAGANQAMRKPIDFDKFFATIDRLLTYTH